MSYGILLLRVVLGLTMAGHGAQKLFGSFSGPGLRGVEGFMGALRFRTPFLMAILAGASEFFGGLLLAGGLFTPFAALAIAVVMLNAIGTVHISKGFWNSAGGYEFNLLIWASAVALAFTGGARFSLDALLGWADNLGGLWWGVGVALASAVISSLTLGLMRHAETPAPAQEDEPAPLPA
jgi:putative oxidoreductase